MSTGQPAHRWIEGSPRLHAVTWHEGRPRTVLLVHGANQHARYWDRLVPLLLEYRVAALDLRGCGQSEWAPPGGYSLDGYVEDIARGVEACGGPEGVAIVAHSMGALAGMAYAARHAGRLWAAAFIDIDPCPPARQAERLHAAGQRPARVLATAEEVRGLIDRLTPGLPPEAVAMLAAEGYVAAEGGYVQRMDQRTLAEFPEVDNRPLLPSINMPALVVRGTQSTVSTLEAATEAAALIPRGRLALVDGDHQVHVQRPEVLAAALLPFLQDAAPR
jgi:pimeloyl-ACP methyl ester carboxylesterase